ASACGVGACVLQTRWTSMSSTTGSAGGLSAIPTRVPSGGGNGGTPARALCAEHGRDRGARGALRPGRSADGRPAAAADRRVRAGDRPFLRLQGLADPRNATKVQL